MYLLLEVTHKFASSRQGVGFPPPPAPRAQPLLSLLLLCASHLLRIAMVSSLLNLSASHLWTAPGRESQSLSNLMSSLFTVCFRNQVVGGTF